MPKQKLENKAATALSKTMERDILANDEVITDPLQIISNTSLRDFVKSDDDLDRSYNNIEDVDTKIESQPVSSNTPSKEALQQMDEQDYENQIPKVRKVAIKKIEGLIFRLGLEKQPEKYKLFPGVGHRWQCPKKGDAFVTGFDDHPEERTRLEKILRVDLGPQSSHWANLTFRLEAKEHGLILNFDDPQDGAYNEMIYYGLLNDELIANGLQEYLKGKKPKAEWYIENKEAEAEMKEADMTAEMEASAALRELSYTKRRSIAKLLSGRTVNTKQTSTIPAWGTSDKIVAIALWEWVRQSSDNAKEFLALLSKNDIEINVRVLAADAIKMNIIRRNSANEYFYADSLLGPTVDHVVQKLSSAPYSSVRSAVSNQINLKS